MSTELPFCKAVIRIPNMHMIGPMDVTAVPCATSNVNGWVLAGAGPKPDCCSVYPNL